MALLLVAMPVAAAPLQVTALGTFSSLDDAGGLLPFSAPMPDTAFELTFSFDPAAAVDVLPDDPTWGFYRHVGDMKLEIGDLPAITGFDDSFVAVQHQFLGSFDFWQATAVRDDVVRSTTFGLYLAAFCGCILDSDALVAPAWPGGWDDGRIFYEVVDATTGRTLASARADINSISVVPVPAVGWIVALALVARVLRQARAGRRYPA